MKVSITLIIINIICYFLSIQFIDSNIFFGLNNLLFKGFYWQPLTSMFMHGSFNHLAMNMVVLFQLGFLIEKRRGWKFFLFFYLIGGVLSALLSLIFMIIFNLDHTLVGASGSLSVLLGFLACKDKELRYGLILMIVFVSFVPEFFGMQIAWYTHFIGFGLGYLYALIENYRKTIDI